MGCFRSSDKKEKKSCGRKLCCFVTTISVFAIAGALTWYFNFFAKDVTGSIADCGGCYCIPDNSTSFKCPSSSPIPPTSYPEETHLNAWKSQTILNPYLLNCNPFEDGVFCDTEPPLDPDFRWAKLGETAVCAIHYESQGEEINAVQERMGGRRRLEQQSEIIAVQPNPNETTIANTDENDANFAVFASSGECENAPFYRIKTYASRKNAEEAGGFVTHVGNCGVCSTLQDLAVYANIDFVGLTSPGNFCRRQATTSFENGISCYRGLGMTQDCAKIWADTSWNTARKCFGSCVVKPTVPLFGAGDEEVDGIDSNSSETGASDKWYNIPATLRNRFFSSSNETDTGPKIPSNGPAPECTLNTCITCNDEISAPTFELFAGRSRRRSGLQSTAARLCGSIPTIDHSPCPVTMPLSDLL